MMIDEHPRVETLPSSISDADRSALDAFGVRFGKVDLAHPLFIHVTLPDGWWVRGFENTNAARTLQDHRCRDRAVIRYEFGSGGYTQATINVLRRYSYAESMSHADVRDAVVVNVYDGTGIQFVTASRPFDNRFAASYFPALEAAKAEARDWLDQNFPGWTDPTAYWQ